MNKYPTKSNLEKSSFKSLCYCNMRVKPLHIVVIEVLESAISFIGRLALCNTQSNNNLSAMTPSAERFVINGYGKWVPAKR